MNLVNLARKTYWKENIEYTSGRKNSLKIKFLGGIFLGHQGSTSRDIPDPTLGCPEQKLYARRLLLLF